MAKLILQISTQKTKETLRQEFERSVSSKYATVQSMAQFLQSIISGGQSGGPPTVLSSIETYATRASGTFTLTNVIATDAVVINGVTFTCSAGAPGTNQFQVGADDDETADNMVAAINASATALISGYVTAEKTSTAATPSVVKVWSTNYGIFGNQITFVSNDSTIVANVARLAGGAVDSGAKSYTF